MYKKIRALKSVPQKYEGILVNEGVISRTQVDSFRDKYYAELEHQLEASYDHKPVVQHYFTKARRIRREMEGNGPNEGRSYKASYWSGRSCTSKGWFGFSCNP
jgi:2-oxoglutarate dehydrogenase complex dehydrogenase (E1) component-like enzyme